MFRILVVVLGGLAIQVCARPGGAGETVTTDCTSSSTPTTTAPPADSTPDANYQQKFAWFTRFADAFMYPNNTIEAASINSTLFSEDVQGRVDLTSTFDGRELNTEVRHPHYPLERDMPDISTSLDYSRR